jgi:hypothetical protein
MDVAEEPDQQPAMEHDPEVPTPLEDLRAGPVKAMNGRPQFKQPTGDQASSEQGELDLTTESIGPKKVGPRLTPYDPSKHREWVRGLIAMSLVIGLVGFLAYTTYIFALAPNGVDELLKYMGVVVSPLIGLVGAVTGFYFGDKGIGSAK